MRQNAPITLKALGPKGEITGFAARFNETDLTGEQIVPGAFAGTIQDWRRRGLPVPMLAFHDDQRPIGAWRDLRETSEGLMVEGSIISNRPVKGVCL
ncbi:MAG TPA: HK97 family phage prohead protease [Candidatus Hydrogenedentes bacterium]|nr:HK97 family phage prohead protease [Candidatus Hydrogenedentota bacterium]